MRQVADFDVEDFENVASRKGVYAKFYITPEKDEKASAEAGRPVYVDRECIEIIAAGNSNNIVRRFVREADKTRFREEYTLFKAGSVEQVVGTPLSEIPWMAKSQCEELYFMKIRTLEQLAALDDQVCSKMAGLYDLKRKAAAWLKKSEEAKPFTAMAEELDQLKKQLAALTAEKGKKG